MIGVVADWCRAMLRIGVRRRLAEYLALRLLILEVERRRAAAGTIIRRPA